MMSALGGNSKNLTKGRRLHEFRTIAGILCEWPLRLLIDGAEFLGCHIRTAPTVRSRGRIKK